MCMFCPRTRALHSERRGGSLVLCGRGCLVRHHHLCCILPLLPCRIQLYYRGRNNPARVARRTAEELAKEEVGERERCVAAMVTMHELCHDLLDPTKVTSLRERVRAELPCIHSNSYSIVPVRVTFMLLHTPSLPTACMHACMAAFVRVLLNACSTT